MKRLADDIWIKGYPLSVLGTHHGRNVTVIRLSSGKLVIHSMAPFPTPDVEGIRALGEPGWLVESMLLHDTYAGEGRRLFPGIPFLGPPGFSKIVGFPVEPLHPGPMEWQGEIEIVPIRGAPKLEEQAMIHLPSRTLILADLIFNFPADEKGWDRFFHRHIAGFRRYPGMSRVFRLFIKDKTAFLESIDELLEKDFDRIIVGHGNVIETDGKALLVRGLRDAGVY
ncbi:hypothetical protein OVA24_05070 [Luteolibacter sp. SL250]|uniref:hypothetical protein n=1 Tax=Luteolibacter sp. SL250 TaxID=2995170 RepID=UPI00226DF416|nr:hypothetical protein [Luteolibacter sp. SL250]WAC20752.1 hypothetical protein OVA24_05070 [Luteolibacter sp. SL250]